MKAIKLMIADDHSMVRESLKYLLESEDFFQVIAEAKDGAECLEILSKQNPDILILDINMPNKSGIDVLNELSKNSKEQVKILILTGCSDVEILWNAVRSGIDGLLLKSSDFEELKKAIFTISNGEVFIQESLSSLLEKERVRLETDSDKIESLTKRELDVLQNLALGMYNKEIALKLEISERTVKNHISSIFRKVGVADRTQAAVFAIRNNLINIYG